MVAVCSRCLKEIPKGEDLMENQHTGETICIPCFEGIVGHEASPPSGLERNDY